jgi:hypothetical protein
MKKSLHMRVFQLMFAAIAATAPGATAQTVVLGTGNPDVDVPAVQYAVDQGGEVVLRGHFSFDRPPTMQTALVSAGYPPATVLVGKAGKAVTISGVGSENDDMTTIEGGTIPFYVEAAGVAVRIQGLRFVRPKGEAILVYAATGLIIASCKIEGVEPLPNKFGSLAIEIDTNGNPPTPTQPGKPENISGTVLIANNDIDVAGGTENDNTLGITVFSVGTSPGSEVDLYVSGNRIRNVTEPAINLRRIGGRAHVEGNVVTTGPISSRVTPQPDAIRIANTGSFEISHNRINCEWPDPDAKGIGVFSQFAVWPMEHANVLDNDVTMLPPPDTMFGNLSAGIDVRGFAQGNTVANNRIRGRARAALAMDVFKGGTPGNNAFIHNRFDDLNASQADLFVYDGVPNTLIVGQKGTVEDHGVNTVIVPFLGSDDPADRDGGDHEGR